jgi:predicted transcriptional regulator YdeE
MKFTATEPFTVAGIQARTSNEREMSPEGLIPGLWAQFMGEGLLAQIPHRADGNIIALYTDYESDHKGKYTVVLGAKVSSVGELPQGMVAKHVPASICAVFEASDGPPESVVPETWRTIWSDTSIDRSYTADFELYGDNRIEIHIAVTKNRTVSG